MCEDLHKLILINYCSGSPYYPDIKGIKFVSCLGIGLRRTDFKPIIELRKCLYDVASSMMVTLGRFSICIVEAIPLNKCTDFCS